LFGLWCATHPYYGYYHDTRLYLLQALARLNPAAYSDDLFVRYGSQDNFSAFGAILAFAISRVGLHAAGFVLLIFGEALWLAGAVLFARCVFGRGERGIAALLAVLLLPAAYGDTLTFHYGEPFLTPRLYSEALVLFAAAMAVRRAWLVSVGFLAVAAALHPLMAIPGIGLVFLLAAQERRVIWLLPLLGVPIFVGLVLAGVEPFVRLRETFGDDWWNIVYERTKLTFPSRWRVQDDIRILLHGSIGLLAYWYGEPADRRILRALGILVPVCFAITLIGGDGLRDLLIVNLQLYRVTWLLSLVVNAAAGALALRAFQSKLRLRPYIAVAIAIYFLDRFAPFMVYAALPVFVILCIATAWERRHAGLPRFLELTVFAVTLPAAVAAVVITAAVSYLATTRLRSHFGAFDLAALCLIACALVMLGRGWRRTGLSFSLAAIGLALSVYDQRLPWEQFVESDSHPPPEVRSLVDQYKNIYWERGLELVWFNIDHSTYFSCAQGSGIIFYRDTALEYLRRGAVLSELNTIDFEPSGGACIPRKDEAASEASVTRQALSNVCNGLPDLDLLVLLSDVPGAPRTEWEYAAPLYLYVNTPEGHATKEFHHFYFYRCADFRAR
jgi:hypothetical protein